MTTDSVHSSILLAHVARGRAWVSRYVDLNDAHVCTDDQVDGDLIIIGLGRYLYFRNLVCILLFVE